ncbi:hypothetical protein MKJ04_17635 [Pontibacter sp. E15-1]|uniref:hypothetical protein n=1 Tax=Pontibacter sp. E15-1 TaxID=2919918 RepID=UPI001F4F74BE|nr:hypothetical protein [Pontibacter sp. E15-1]MCJ8166672.1 hypothetical protein [Pontibacter sp. E15-1]
MALFLAASAAQAQAPIKHTQEAFADVTMLGDDLLLYTKKESQGQYLYREAKGKQAIKDTQLNAGTINAVVGNNPATGELYVYQQRGRRDKHIAVYKYENGDFTKTDELEVPRFRNNSENLGMFLTEDRNQLIISGELSKSEGYDDLYLSQRQDGKWGKPVKMSGSVNSRQAEFAPYLTADSLFFSRKQGNAAYVYAVPMKDGQPVGEPMKLEGAVNEQDAFNAYYKKAGERELWVSSRAGDYFAYLNEPAPAKEEVVVAEQVEAAPAKPAAPTAQNLYFGFNEVYMGTAAEQQLKAFLEVQQPGASLSVKGFSDAKGPAKGRQKVSSQRAAFVQWYILNKFGEKNFTVKTSHQVLDTVTEEGRRVELQVK